MTNFEYFPDDVNIINDFSNQLFDIATDQKNKNMECYPYSWEWSSILADEANVVLEQINNGEK